MNWFEFPFWFSLLASSLRLATPLVFAAMGGYFSEKSGVINLGLEGVMLIGAFFAAVGNLATGSPIIGILFAIAMSTLFALFHAISCVSFRSNQVVTGMAINILAAGLTPLLSNVLYKTTSSTPSIDLTHHMKEWTLPFVSKIPFVGDVLGHQTPLVYLAIASVFVIHYWSIHRPTGLHLRAVGENPEASDSLGVSVNKVRYFGVLMSGVFCGLGGAFLSIGHASSFSRDMTAGSWLYRADSAYFWKMETHSDVHCVPPFRTNRCTSNSYARREHSSIRSHRTSVRSNDSLSGNDDRTCGLHRKITSPKISRHPVRQKLIAHS